MTGGYLDPQFMAGKCDLLIPPQFMAKLKQKMMIIITMDCNILQMQKKGNHQTSNSHGNSHAHWPIIFSPSKKDFWKPNPPRAGPFFPPFSPRCPLFPPGVSVGMGDIWMGWATPLSMANSWPPSALIAGQLGKAWRSRRWKKIWLLVGGATTYLENWWVIYC